jgi:PTH1 family peptidyl-tRNA hydrolase
MAFRKKPQAAVDLLVVGLGNPGGEYRDTRHNLGFMVVDELAKRMRGRVTDREGKSLTGRVLPPRGRAGAVLLAKPQTYMNLSGRAVSELLDRHRLTPDDLWVVYDEMDLDFGKLRVRKDGGPGGHNGVKSIIESLGTQSFVRFRVGVGRPESGDPVDHLLTGFSSAEDEKLPALIGLAADAVIDGLADGIDVAMNRHNGRSA